MKNFLQRLFLNNRAKDPDLAKKKKKKINSETGN